MPINRRANARSINQLLHACAVQPDQISQKNAKSDLRFFFIIIIIFFLRAGITQQCDAFVCVFCPLIIHANYDTMLIHG